MRFSPLFVCSSVQRPRRCLYVFADHKRALANFNEVAWYASTFAKLVSPSQLRVEFWEGGYAMFREQTDRLKGLSVTFAEFDSDVDEFVKLQIKLDCVRTR